MKLIYINNGRMPTEKAHGAQIMQMLQAFAGLPDTQVAIIVPWRFNQIPENPFDYYSVKPLFKIIRLPCLDLIPLSPYIGHLGAWVQTFTFLISTKIYLLLKKYDILFSREHFSPIFFKNIISEVHILPTKTSFHKKIWRRAKKLIVLTSFMKDKMIEAGVPEKKILVSPDAVNLDDFNIKTTQVEARKKLNLSVNAKIAMYIGSIQSWKGHEVFLDASRLIKDMQFVLIGGRKEQIKELKVKYPNVLFLGELPYKDLPVNQRAADVLIIPNTGKDIISARYTSPLKVFAHMASNIPIVVSDLPAMREVLNENNSVLVKPDNVAALAEGIKRVLADKNLADTISRQAFADVQNYTWQKRAETILKFIS